MRIIGNRRHGLYSFARVVAPPWTGAGAITISIG